MTEMRISSKCRGLVEDRLTHGGAHGFACFVIPKFEKLPNLCVCDTLQANCPKAAVCKQGCKLDERQSVRSEHIQRIAKKLVRSRAEVVKAPALPENRSELSDANEIR